MLLATFMVLLDTAIVNNAVPAIQSSLGASAAQIQLVLDAYLLAYAALLIYPIVEGRALGWPAWSVGSLGAALMTLGLFGLDQRRKAARGVAPLIDPALFHDRAFRIGLPISLIFFSGVYSFFLALSICLQAGFGLTALQAALTIVPFQSASLFASLLSARVAHSMGTSVLILGEVLLCIGTGGVIATLALQGASLQGLALLPPLLIGGAGFGLIIGPLTTLILAGVRLDLAAAAAGVLGTAQQVGGALGIAVVGALLFGHIEGPTAASLPARAALFSQATQVALCFNLGAFAVSLALFFLLPATSPAPLHSQPATDTTERIPGGH